MKEKYRALQNAGRKIEQSLFRKIAPLQQTLTEKKEKLTEESRLLLMTYESIKDFGETEISVKMGNTYDETLFRKKLIRRGKSQKPLDNPPFRRSSINEKTFLITAINEAVENITIKHLLVCEFDQNGEIAKGMRFEGYELISAKKRLKTKTKPYSYGNETFDLSGRERINFLKEVNAAPIDNKATSESTLEYNIRPLIIFPGSPAGSKN
jgi:hypothetical protein